MEVEGSTDGQGQREEAPGGHSSFFRALAAARASGIVVSPCYDIDYLDQWSSLDLRTCTEEEAREELERCMEKAELMRPSGSQVGREGCVVLYRIEGEEVVMGPYRMGTYRKDVEDSGLFPW